MTVDVRVLEPGELRSAHTLFAATIHRGPRDDAGWERAARLFEPGRTFGAFAGGALVGTAMSFATRTAVPGGAALPTAAVSRVGVRADHTRRGVLTALMAAQLDDAVARGDVLASLRASEAVIYGRFGYGVASRARHVRVARPGTALRPDAPAGGTVRLLGPAELPSVLRTVHDRLALRHPGGIERPAAWWAHLEARLADREPVLAAVHAGADGDDGLAVAFPGTDADRRVLRVEDLHAADAAATAGLWRFLVGVDLVDAVTGWLRPLDEPLELLLADPRRCAVTGHEDETWLRLLDVPAALAARAYRGDGAVTLGVHDPLLPANTGVLRITASGAEPVTTVPDLECDVAGLAMAYLGDRRPSELVATGWWTACDRGAVARADALFATDARPWCGTYF